MTPAAETPLDRIAGHIAIEVMAQLDELSDDTVAAIVDLAAGDDAVYVRMIAVANDLRETLIATVDQRLSDWSDDNADALG